MIQCQESCVSLVIISLQTVIGSLVNGFMVRVNLMDLVAQGRLNSSNSILTCLGVSRFSLLWLILAMYALKYVKDAEIPDGTTEKLLCFYFFLSNTNMWFSTWLCTSYCVRIANVQHYLFVTFKNNFDRFVPLFLVTSCIISLVFSIPSAYNIISNFGNWSKWDHSNYSSPFIPSNTNVYIVSVLCALGTAPPFFIFCCAAWLVVNSLWKHTRMMKGQERTGFREPSLKAHYGAVKSMGLFFFFYVLYLIAFYAMILVPGTSDDILWGGVFTTMIGAYPSLHSVFLLHGNSKLQQTFIRQLQKSKCFCFRKTMTKS